jgi:predicted membrane-bound mannosyltransferase
MQAGRHLCSVAAGWQRFDMRAVRKFTWLEKMLLASACVLYGIVEAGAGCYKLSVHDT